MIVVFCPALAVVEARVRPGYGTHSIAIAMATVGVAPCVTVRQAPVMVPESRLESTKHGLVPMGDGWFVLNAREARWLQAPGRSAICEFEGAFEGEQDFLQLGINLSVLGPGEPMAMYHWEADQEDFLVLAGEALLIVEGKSARSDSGTSCTARPGRSTRSSAPATGPA